MNKKSDITIDKLNGMPAEQVRFKHFVSLRSGYDKYSELTLFALRPLMQPADIVAVETAFLLVPEQHRAYWISKAYRWILRGLRTSLAIQKIKVDMEVHDKAEKAKQ